MTVSEKNIFRNSGEINKDGLVNLNFNHASEYLLVISDIRADSGDDTEQPEVSDQGTDPSSGEVENSDNYYTEAETSATTGDYINVWPAICAMLLCAGVIVMSMKCRKKEK